MNNFQLSKFLDILPFLLDEQRNLSLPYCEIGQQLKTRFHELLV